MALMALNVQLVNSKQKDGELSKLSLDEISVIAQSGSEKKCNSIEDCPADMVSLTKDGEVYCCSKPEILLTLDIGMMCRH